MSGQTWTPAPRAGIIPLHPLTFGMLLGKAFAALRHNPKVLFGFAVVLQLVVVLATSAVMIAVFFTTFSRLETVPPGSADFEAVLAGTIATNILAAFGVGLASVAFTAVMQGVVAADIGFAALGEKATLGQLWRRMRPAFWRLLGFACLSILAFFGLFAVIAGIVAAFVAGGVSDSAAMIGLVVVIVLLILLACIPLVVWLSTKLLLVPSILVLEGATFRTALVRSWRLTRGRFWVAFGVVFLINAIMGLAMQVVSVPATLLSGLLGGVIAPTGDADTASVVAYALGILAPQVLVLVLQAIAIVVQCTGAALVYLDCRMRYEGLDQTLIAFRERRDLGWSDAQQGDPFAVDPARAVSRTPPPRQTPEYAAAPVGWAPAPGAPAHPGYAPPAYPGYGPAQPGYPPAAPPPPPPATPSAAPPPSDSPWAPPGSGSA